MQKRIAALVAVAFTVVGFALAGASLTSSDSTVQAGNVVNLP